MNEAHISRIAEELDVIPGRVQAAAALLEDGATVPFIARYRKEATGSLDEVAVATIRDRLDGMRALDKRCEAILKSLAERELLTPELKAQIAAADTLATLEDIYLPYRPRRRTRATIAREKGLELLARLLLDSPAEPSLDPIAEAAAFVNEEKGVATADDALAGARDIIAETISEDARARMAMRALYSTRGVIKSRVVKGQEGPGAKYKDYFEWEEPLAIAPSHRVLAMRRGEKETFLSLKIEPPEDVALAELHCLFVAPPTTDSRGGAPEPDSPVAQQLTLAVADGYKRLLAPAMTTEMWAELKRRADDEAIRVFAGNLRELLLAPPLGQKHVLAIDPGFRTGCKLVCLDEQGKLIHSDTIYPHAGEARAQAAAETLRELCRRFDIEAIAIGNGTEGRETDAFVRGLELPGQTTIVMVNESGASIYSASETAREEFPDHDLTVRGAVSIGRRLMNPLAELIKIEPKSIGVGQYQHDVDQGALRRALDDVVMSCVNAVGVDLNTASKQLLTYVSGFGPQLAQNIVAFRDEHGPFATRRELTKVPRLGPKAFEQAAGFLRIRNGKNPLDASAVHPECYPVVAAIATDLGCQAKDLMRDSSLRDRIDLKRYVTEKVGLPTLRDIRAELAIPGRDPREEFEAFNFTENINSIEDIKIGLTLSGLVTNVTAFGAFVDIGVHQDGLVHISQLADRFVRDPAAVVKIQQKVTVRVIGVDLERKRISLSMKSAPERNE